MEGNTNTDREMTTPLIGGGSASAAEADEAFHDASEDLSDAPGDGSQGDTMSTLEGSSTAVASSRLSQMRASSDRPRKGSFVDRSAQWPRRLSDCPRNDHMAQLIQQRRQSMTAFFPEDGDGRIIDESVLECGDLSKTVMEMHSEFVRHLKEFSHANESFQMNLPSMEVRLQNFSYKVPSLEVKAGEDKIQNIYNTSPLYTLERWIKRLTTKKEDGPKEKHVTTVLSDVNLVLKPGSMYLVLGPPLSGKTSLLKAIAGMLPQGNFPAGYPEKKFLTGQVLYNNLKVIGEGADESQRTLFENLVAFVRQNDFHAPRLTVAETFLFSGKCKDENIRKNKKGVSKDGKVGLTLEGLGLSHVQDTFVGNETIRGVSGGQRRRVTLGEMFVFDTPLMCGDEISTGLDTASTVDILRILSYVTRTFSRISVVSLLQPSPEAVALFDEVILLSDGGNIIFSGPTCDAVSGRLAFSFLSYSWSDPHRVSLQCDYFRKLGYVQPDSMDNADYLLAVASSDRTHLYRPELAMKQEDEPHSPQTLASSFQQSKGNEKITENLQKKWEEDWNEEAGASSSSISSFKKKYQNSFWASVGLNFKRALVLWTRDKIFIRASLIKNIAMGLSGFFLYLALFFSFNFTMGQLFGLFAAVAPSKTVVQAGGAVILLLNCLFCGYLVAPTVIPNYYIWIYWMMPLAWVYRALILNEFTSEEYAENELGKMVLRSSGFLYKGEPFTREWIGYCFAYLIPFLVLCMVASALCLQYFRMEPKRNMPAKIDDESSEKDTETKSESLRNDSFIPVTLSFKDLSYEVKASKGSDKLRLLNDISGIFSAGRLCALMGESGAGKTTLMDVIALRKSKSGSVTGEVLLNGFPQSKTSFRRCSGYVEQFDVQSAELTVRETIRFSAELRLDRSSPVYDEEDGFEAHIDFIIRALELTREADILVGNEEEGGLTFEQKKRLSIAVELAASPSIVFLDEPTSGLDARAALLVMKALRKICDSGRTVVATIHQPSSTVFDMFDDLLLMKKGGETVYFGPLGPCSCDLVSYFEDLGTSRMNKGENPATWMLNVLGEQIMVKGENGEEEPLNFARAWELSSKNAELQQRLAQEVESPDPACEIKYDTEFAASAWRRDTLMANRLVMIYWRSPAYNLSRMVLAVVIAFLLGSIFIPIRSKDVLTEAEITSMLSTIFIAFIIIGVLSITSVLPVMLSIRDMYYRHKAAGMLSSRSVARALASAEKRFILISAVLFCAVFVPTSGIVNSPSHDFKAIAFWGFFTFNTAIYSYIGQLFMCLVRGPGTAQILASIFIGINNFFSGLIVRPQQMTGFWQITYWINPGHFVYEGLCMSVFHRDTRNVTVGIGSQYYYPLNCEAIEINGVCEVTVSEYVDAFFGGLFQRDHIRRNAIILGMILLMVRALTFVALRYLTYSGK
ncbi:hypothetical protein ACHAWF_010122 [Thalassiosira exigua]